MNESTGHPKSSSLFPGWLKLLFVVGFLGLVFSSIGMFFAENVNEVVEKQLTALREHKVSQAYYEYTSKEFQRATSLDLFREFLALYPVLSQNKSVRIEDVSVTDGKSAIRGVIVSKEFQEMEAMWQLVKEEGGWKIQSLKLTEMLKEDEKKAALDALTNRVIDQLKAIRKNDLIQAYYGFVSKDFQKETTLQVFENFLREHPILFNYRKLDVKNTRIENDQAYIDLNLLSDGGNYLLEYKLAREGDQWRIFNLRVVLPAEAAAKKISTNPEALVTPVRELLEMLANGKPYEAYNGTAEAFQESTPYPEFQQFLTTYPALTEREFADIKSGLIENGTGKIQANLHDAFGLTTVAFKMGFDEGEWRVWGIEVVKSPAQEYVSIAADEEQPIENELLDVVLKLQNYLLHQDVYEAYGKIMSATYRQNHSLDEFISSLSVLPVLLDYRSSYFNRVLDNGTQASLKGTINTLQDVTYYVRFDFSWEGDLWKVEKVTVQSEQEPIAMGEIILDKPAFDLPPNPPRILTFLVGSEVNAEGMIVTPLTVLNAGIQLIYFNASLVNAPARTQVTLFLTHVESGSSAPHLSTMLEEGGNTVVSFAFAAPLEGWPPGEYIAKVQTSSGQESIQRFTIAGN